MMDKLDERLAEIAAKLQEVIERIGPDVANAVGTAVTFDGAIALGLAAFMSVLVTAFGIASGFLLYFARPERERVPDESRRWSEERGWETGRTVLGIVSGVAAFVFLVIGMKIVFYPYNWLAIHDPTAALAYKLLLN